MTDTTQNVLAEEMKYFEANKQEWLNSYRGQFVLVKGSELIGTFTTQEEAYKKGVEKFNNEPFLIKQVIEQETTASVPALTIGLINVRL